MFILFNLALKLKHDDEERKLKAGKIISFLENNLSTKENEIFWSSYEIFTDILNKEIEPRGVWSFYSSRKDEDPVFKLCVCYGDLIYDIGYVYDYENEPIVVKEIDEIVSFIKDFKEIFYITVEYVKQLYAMFSI